MSSYLHNVLAVIQTMAILLTAYYASTGINSWRRELQGKKEYELAERVLALLYQCREDINVLRHPFYHAGEGSTRVRREDETEEESKIYDQAYVVFERFNKTNSFNELASLKYRFMVHFGKETAEAFDGIQRQVSLILYAANTLGRHYWKTPPHSEGRLQRFNKDKEKWEKTLWWAGEEDKISTSVDGFISQIEEVCLNAIRINKPNKK